MQNKLSCDQVISLVNFYLEDKLTEKLKAKINNHLKKCKKCKSIYEYAVKISKSLQNNFNMNQEYNQKTANKFSAYIDNELNEDENLKVRKIAISNPNARNQLTNMLKFREMLHNSFRKTEDKLHTDYSKKIVNLLNNKKRNKRVLDINNLVIYLSITLLICVFCYIGLLNL